MQHDEGRQLLIHRAKTIREPRAERCLAGLHRASANQLIRRFVVDGICVHRLDDADIIGHFCNPRQQFADPRARLAVLGKFKNRRREREGRLPGSHPGEALSLGFQITVEIFPEAFLQFRLVVEQINLRRSADERYVNRPLRFWCDLR